MQDILVLDQPTLTQHWLLHHYNDGKQAQTESNNAGKKRWLIEATIIPMEWVGTGQVTNGTEQERATLVELRRKSDYR